MVPLEFGDPWVDKAAADKAQYEGGAGATYTCFLFPFAFQSVRDPEPDRDGTSYQLQDAYSAAWLRRRRYVTRKTVDVLSEQARWLRVPAEEWDKKRRGWQYPRSFKAALHSRELILFEWRSDIIKDSAPDPFQTGFLLLEADFPAGQDSPPTRDDLVHFNFRFRRPLFSGHADRLMPVVGQSCDAANSDSRPLARANPHACYPYQPEKRFFDNPCVCGGKNEYSRARLL